MKEKNRCLKKNENFANKKALALFEKELGKRVKQAIIYRVWYNRIRLFLSAGNRMKMKGLTRNLLITKCFLFNEKSFLILLIRFVVPFFIKTLTLSF